MVDDEADVRWSVAEVLRSAGFSVAEAEDGDVAFDLLTMNRYESVPSRYPDAEAGRRVSDRGHQDGPTCCRASAYILDASERERLGSRVVAYLHKPVSPQKLLRAVEAVLGSEH